MKLHHLTFEGIGPFVDRVSIDFESLASSGLFLLEGATGSGKSTIIDAIVFALYGDVAGGGTSKNRIRSDFMPPTKESFVDLVFEVPGGLYRVRRTPQYQRAALRGKNKLTNQNATAKLWRFASPESMLAHLEGGESASMVEPLASRPADVGSLIPEIVGLTHDQFTQIVVLPQGEFARFLRADTKDRKSVLERVFGTQVYVRIEDAFARARQAAHREAQASVNTLAVAFERVLTASGIEESERESAKAGAGEFNETGLEAAEDTARELELATRTAHEEAKKRVDGAKAALDTATAGFEKARAHETLVNERVLLDQRIAKRDSQRESIAALVERTQLHERAEAPHHAHEAARKARAELEAAAQRIGGTAALVDLRETPDQWATRAEHEDHTARHNTARAAELTALVAEEASIPALEKELAALENTATAAKEHLARLTAALEKRPSERTALEAKRASLVPKAEAHAEHAARETALAAQQAATTRSLTERATVSVLEDNLREATLVAQEAVDYERDLRKARIDGMAAELALELEDEAACPVCGSTSHPQPARHSGEAVSQEAIDAVERARQEREANVAALGSRHSAAVATLRASLREAGVTTAGGESSIATSEGEGGIATSEGEGGIDMPEGGSTIDKLGGTSDSAGSAHLPSEARIVEHRSRLEQALEKAREDLAASSEARTALTAAVEKLEAFDAETAELTQKRTAAVLAEHEARSAHTTHAAALESLRARVYKARDARESVKARKAEYEALAAESAGLASILRDAAAHARNESERRAAAQQSLTEHGFETAEQVEAARMSPAHLAQAREQITAHRALESRIAESLDNPVLAALTLTGDSVELAESARVAAAQARTEAEAAHEAASQALAVAAQTHTATTNARTNFARVAAAHREGAAAHAEILHLAGVVTGNSSDTRARLTLSTFAVMQRFEAVVQAANARLSTLSSGEFEILLAGAENSGNKQVGLDLLVMDHRSDKARDPRTLSGGETFYVSLALALGLADIVSAESGGIHMNTLFIDEGFGSLDPERLDGVISEIRNLGRHGRAVGIVSHVADLKMQIPDKIHVERTSRGTSTVRVGG